MQSCNFWIAHAPSFIYFIYSLHVICAEVNTNPIIDLPIYQDPILLSQHPNPFANSS